MAEELKYVELSFAWRITLNPEGSGLLLCVDRGINCECHTQVLSVHTTNTPSMETVQKVVEESKEKTISQINAFVTLMHTLTDWSTKEHIALVFKHNLLKEIADEAEKLEFS